MSRDPSGATLQTYGEVFHVEVGRGVHLRRGPCLVHWRWVVVWVSPLAPWLSVAPAGASAAESRTFADVSALGATPLVVPVVLAALALWCAWRVRPRALLATGLTLAAFSFVTGFSIGAAYLPAAAAIVLAGVSSLSRAS